MQPAEFIIYNADIVTMDATRPRARAMAVRNGRILRVGSEEEIEWFRGNATESLDGGGACVMPGLHDVHNHHAIAGRTALFECSLPGGAGLDEVLDALSEYAESIGTDQWITGGNVSAAVFAQLRTAESLRRFDAATQGRPAVLRDGSQHNRWANTRALEFAGIDQDSADPPGGRIEHDPATGRPTGVLIESASALVDRVVREYAPLSVAQYARASEHGIATLHSHGVTALQDAGATLDLLQALELLEREGRLKAWVVTSLLANDPIFGADPVGRELAAVAQRYRGVLHRPDFVKVFLDGVPGARTSAFLAPYLPDRNHGDCYRGATAMPIEELQSWIRWCGSNGMSAKIHCTGDAAVRMALDAIETVRAEGVTHVRFHIAHGQYIDDADLPRLAALGVDADISPPLWFPGFASEAVKKVIPEHRASRAQPNRTLLDLGALVAGGSDWPVSASPSVWGPIQGLITRSDPTGRFSGTLWPEQAISLHEALAAYTTAASEAMGLAQHTGSLSAGKAADFILLDRNPYEINPETIAGTKVLQTWFGGSLAFER